MSTPFGDSTQQYQQSSKVDAGNGVAVTASSTGTIAKSKSYKLVKSSTGSNLYVEVCEMDCHPFMISRVTW
jgi:ribosomal protein L31